MMGQDEVQDTLELSTGVVLRLLTPSPVLVDNLMKVIAAEEPKPPMVFIEDKGREDPNPSDPDFVFAHQRWRADAGLRTLRALIPTGSKIESLPDDFDGPEDEGYVDLIESMGEVLPAGRHARYVQWVMLVAMGPQDLSELSRVLLRRAGVREEDVRAAQETFQSDEERTADNGVSPDRGGADGHKVRTARTRSRTRN